MRKNLIILTAATLLLLTGCGNIDKGTSSVSPGQAGEDKRVVTGKIDSGTYQALLNDGKYKPASARGLTANIMNSNYNSANFEKGLLELSKDEFSVENHLFQEGQMLSRDEILGFVNRKGSSYPNGLNVPKGEGPIIFQQILEQDYYDKESRNLTGISIGIAINSVDYSEDEPVEIDDATVDAEGKRVAQVILEHLRKKSDLENIPIKIGLFKQAAKDNIAGGNYFATTLSKKGTTIGDWETVVEEYVALPGNSGDSNPAVADGLANKYTDFRNSIQNFFPNSSGISGVARYRDNQLEKFSIVIDTKYFSETEIINFTQFIAQLVEQAFNVTGEVEVVVKTLEGLESIVTKSPGSEIAEIQIFN